MVGTRVVADGCRSLNTMDNPFTGEPNPLEITVTAEVVGNRGDSVILHAVVEDGTASDGGDIEVRISGSAMSAYGINACVTELESVLNRSFRPAYRLDAAIALGAEGAFTIVTSAGTGPRVLTPTAARLAA